MPSRRHKLLEACAQGSLAAFEEALATEDVNQTDKDGSTPLFKACQNGHAELVSKLLEMKNLDLNQTNMWGCTALWIACKLGRTECVEVLLKKRQQLDLTLGSKEGKTPLHKACQNNHLDVLKLLLTKGRVDPNDDSFAQTPLALACIEGHFKVVEYLLDHRKIDVNKCGMDGCTALMHACVHGQARALEQLLAYQYRPGEIGIIVNPVQEVSGRTAFFEACVAGSLDILHILLKQYGVADAINQPDLEGWTALIGAVDARKVEVVKLLLEQPQTDVNVMNANWTALSRASWHGDANLVELLLSSKKIDVNLAPENSMTPLFQAVRQGHVPVVKLLLKHPNIDPNRPAKEGKTALQQACCQSSHTLVDLIVRNKNTDVNSVDMVRHPRHRHHHPLGASKQPPLKTSHPCQF